MRRRISILALALFVSSTALAQASFNAISIQAGPSETGITLMNSGAKFQFGPGDTLYDSAGTLTTSGALQVGGQLNINGSNSIIMSGNGTVFTAGGLQSLGNAAMPITSQATDGPSAVSVNIHSNSTFANADAKVLSIQNNTTEKASIRQDGSIQLVGVASASLIACTAGRAGLIQYDTTLSSLRTCNGTSWTDDNIVDTLDSYYISSVASASTIGYHYSKRAFLVTEIGVGVSSGAVGAGTTVLQITDGTNTCQAAYNCASDTNTAGAKSNTVTVLAGSCTMLPNVSLVSSVVSSTCATTQPTIKNVWIAGQWQ